MHRRRRDKESSLKEAVRRLTAAGYEEQIVKDLYTADSKFQVHVLFSGDKNAQGVSWCPDCNKADPYIQKAITDYVRKDSVFIEVTVGDRDEYKNRNNPFRLDPETRIQEIPTLLRWKTVLRLEGEQCAKPYLLEMLFTEPDEED